MINTLTSLSYLPFGIAFFISVALIFLELATLLLGGSVLGSDGPTDADIDLAGDVEGSFDVADALEAEIDTDTGDAGGLLAWMGLGNAPFLVWFSGLTMSFGSLGIVLQTLTTEVMAAPLSAPIAVIVTLPIAIWCARQLARGFAAVIPNVESSSVDRRRLGGKQGIITQGTATADRPAEARVRDIHGNLHYIRVRAEPGVTIEQGTDVIIKSNRDGSFIAIPLTS
jgi:hypothetical protein